MIISKTPLRISFVGGGSDIIDENNKSGSVISVSINKYIYVLINKRHDSTFRLSYSKNENVKNINQIRHKLIKNTLKFNKVIDGLEIVTIADIPSNGSGLGSSSALTVGLLNCLNCFQKKKKSKKNLALDAYNIEKNLMKQTIGYQDQASAAFGGFNHYNFSKNNISLKRINISNDFCHTLQKYMLMFQIGIGRKAEKILKNINKNKNLNLLSEISDITKEFSKSLYNEDIVQISNLIKKNWNLKKKLDKNISSNFIDQIYNQGISSGALAGKILGAGGGGHFLFLAPPKYHQQIIKSLKGIKKIDFEFEKNGSTLIYNS